MRRPERVSRAATRNSGLHGRGAPTVAGCILGLVGLLLVGATRASAQEPDVASAQAAARAHPTDIEAARHQAIVLVRAGRYSEASRVFHRVSQLRHGDPQALYEEASVGFAANDFRAARNACRALEGRLRDTVFAHVCLARSFLTLNRSARAFEELEIARGIDPNNFELDVAIGEANRLRMNLAESEAAYRAAIRIRPNDAEPHLGLGRLYLAANRRAEALTELRAAAAIDPTWPEVQHELGALVGGEEGLALLRSATRGNPGVASAQVALGELELSLGTPEAARAAFAKAAELDQHLAGAFIGLGRALVRLGRDSEAEAALQKALTLVPNSTASFLVLADIHSRGDRLEDAFEDYRRAADGSPGDPTPLLAAARLAIDNGRDTLAQAFLERLLAINDQLGDAYSLYGDAMMDRRDFPAAVTAYERALATTTLTDRPRAEARLADARQHAAAHP